MNIKYNCQDTNTDYLNVQSIKSSSVLFTPYDRNCPHLSITLNNSQVSNLIKELQKHLTKCLLEEK